MIWSHSLTLEDDYYFTPVQGSTQNMSLQIGGSNSIPYSTNESFKNVDYENLENLQNDTRSFGELFVKTIGKDQTKS